MSVLVTGGASFIGSNFVLEWFAAAESRVDRIIHGPQHVMTLILN